jgi:hypothetical protein
MQRHSKGINSPKYRLNSIYYEYKEIGRKKCILKVNKNKRQKKYYNKGKQK